MKRAPSSSTQKPVKFLPREHDGIVIVAILSARLLAYIVLPATMDQGIKVTTVCHKTTTNSQVVLFAKTL